MSARKLWIASLTAVGALLPLRAALAQQSSPPVILQWFESSWRNIDRRAADLHAAGYGAVWTPPPGRAVYLPQGGGIGYDVYDRFDLGKPRDNTLYGTENGYRQVVRRVQQLGGNVYVDYVHHHLGSFDLQLNGYTYPQALINQGAPYLQDRADYPGFELSDPNNPVTSPFHRDTYADLYGPNEHLRPFGEVFEYWYRLGENLVTVDLTSQRQFVRNPVPGNGQNIRQSPANWAIPTTTIQSNGLVGGDNKPRQANVPTNDNRRFYPDLSNSRTVIDRGVTYTVHDFNLVNPSAGDPTAETTLGYMQRYAQWMSQVIGVDGLRIDAARHVPLGTFNGTYNPNSLNVPLEIDRATAFGTSNRFNLDGTRRNSFNFQEIFNYDSNFLKSFIRKNQPGGDTVNPNRDVLDFSMWVAMAQNMTGNGGQNDWFNIRSASVNAAVHNTLNPNIANNGDHGIGFVYNHDEGVSPPGSGGSIALDNVAHAWTLMRPGNAYVYYRSNEFDRSNNNQFFLKQGRGDALGGQFGQIITKLVDARNSYGRGNFIQRYIDNEGPNGERLGASAIYVFERQGSAVVGLNVGYNAGATTRLVQTSFVPGTRLEEVTGNWQDPSGQVPRVIAVDSNGKANIAIPWNNAQNGNKGYVIYGLPRPRGTMAVTQIGGAGFAAFGNESQNPANNGTALISSIDVVTTDQFKIRLNTNAVTLADGFRDTFADGDRALVKIDEGFDVNGNGGNDNPSSALANSTKYGFESFLTLNQPGFTSGGNGTYEQVVNAANLSEGYHFITTRAWRKQGTNENEVFQDFRRTIYVDRLDPISAADSTAQFPYQADNRSRDIRIKSTDSTANSVHVFLDLGAALSDSQILAMIGAGNKSEQIDSDLFGKRFDNVGSGNHVITSVTYEPSGNFSVQRFIGQPISTSRGLGLGDTNFDGGYSPADVINFEAVMYTQDQQFNAASDLNSDGRSDTLDLYALPSRYASVMQNAPFTEANAAIKRRGDFTTSHVQPANAADIDQLYANFGPYQWDYDLNVTRGPIDQADVDTMLAIIFGTRYGDANLDQIVDIGDFAIIAANFNQAGGWASGNFNETSGVEIGDFALLASNFNQSGPAVSAADLLRGGAVPEPSSIVLFGVAGLIMRRRASSPAYSRGTSPSRCANAYTRQAPGRVDASNTKTSRSLASTLGMTVLGGIASLAFLAHSAAAADVSKPAMLQYFDGSWQTIERRGPDIFMAGYGAMWTPPPSRAETGNGSVGYDVYDRFDLGFAGSYTQYGSERGMKAMVAETHRWGGRHYSDLILNHNGFATRFTSGFTASGGYPGFVLTRGDDSEGDFHQQNYNGGDPYLMRLSGLIDIAQEKNYQYIRNPVPGFANNLPAGTTSFFGKLANVPNENNRRFYPDQQLGGVTYTDPTLPAGQQTVTMYDFNTATPTNGDPMLENAQTYLMRHARWMVQEVGLDGFRLDAVKHFPPAVLNEFDRYLWKSIKTPLLDGSTQHVFSFGEALDGNKGLLQSYIRKNFNAATLGPNTIGGNRDALDFPLFFALKDNLSSNGLQNDWRNVVNASQDSNDDGLANNGSQGVAFTQSHDDTGVTALPRVAHAYTLMRPGEAIVYFNPKEFGQRGNNFPRDGRLDALGGFYGDDITTLVNIRNTHGRGNYTPRVLEKELLAYERDKSAIVFLNNRGDVGFDTRAIQTNFAAGTKLIDLTGNATNPAIDPTNMLPDVVTVGATGIATLTVKRNGAAGTATFSDQGYVIYGLPTPVGNIAVSNVATTLMGATPSAGNNATNILTSMDVITGNSFNVTLATVPVVLPDSTTDVSAGGDRAYLKLNGGINLNGNAGVDFVDPAGTQYGFENFITKNSPLFGGGDGQFVQAIDATNLSEGPNYIEARAYRQRSDGGPDVFSSFRKVIYVDRVAPPSAIDSIQNIGGNNRQIRVKSLDQTVNRAHIFFDQPGNVTDAQILASATSGTNQAGQIDRDLFAFGFNNVGSGNHVIHTVVFEPTGNYTLQKLTGVYIQTGRGLGIGDLDFDNVYETSDINGTQGMEILVYPNLQGQTNTQFNAAADVNGDGLLDTRDLLSVRAAYVAAGAPASVVTESRNAELRRGNIDNAGGVNGNAADIDFLYTRIGQTNNIWRPDLNVDLAVTPADVDVLVRQIFLTEYGDVDLNRAVDIGDFAILGANFNLPGGWSAGNFNGVDGVEIGDFALLAANFNFVGTNDLPRSTVPEPTGFALLAILSGLSRCVRRLI